MERNIRADIQESARASTFNNNPHLSKSFCPFYDAILRSERENTLPFLAKEEIPYVAF